MDHDDFVSGGKLAEERYSYQFLLVVQECEEESAFSEKSADKSQHFALAYEHLAESTTMDASYAPAWFMWGRALYREGRHKEVWDKVKNAKPQ